MSQNRRQAAIRPFNQPADDQPADTPAPAENTAPAAPARPAPRRQATIRPLDAPAENPAPAPRRQATIRPLDATAPSHSTAPVYFAAEAAPAADTWDADDNATAAARPSRLNFRPRGQRTQRGESKPRSPEAKLLRTAAVIDYVLGGLLFLGAAVGLILMAYAPPEVHFAIFVHVMLLLQLSVAAATIYCAHRCSRNGPEQAWLGRAANLAAAVFMLLNLAMRYVQDSVLVRGQQFKIDNRPSPTEILFFVGYVLLFSAAAFSYHKVARTVAPAKIAQDNRDRAAANERLRHKAALAHAQHQADHPPPAPPRKMKNRPADPSA